MDARMPNAAAGQTWFARSALGYVFAVKGYRCSRWDVASEGR